MTKVLKLILASAILLIGNVSYSDESKDKFLEVFMNESTYCQYEPDTSKCKCVGETWYDSMSDKDKGLLILYFEAQESFPDKSDEELSKEFESTYNISEKDKQEIGEAWGELESVFEKQCGYKKRI